MPMTRSNCCRCWERIKVRSPPRIWMHTWTSSPFASTAGNRAVGECSSIACWKMPSQHSQRDIGLQEPTEQHQNTTCSGYCTKAATPLCPLLRHSRPLLHGDLRPRRGSLGQALAGLPDNGLPEVTIVASSMNALKNSGAFLLLCVHVPRRWAD